jgi:hypothetical protein
MLTNFENPWLKMTKQTPYILEIDRAWYREYEGNLQKIANKKNKAEKHTILYNHSIRTDNYPFPYYGNPDTAKVIVLQANPGYDIKHNQRPFADDMLELDYQNLLHNPNPPLYSMLPKYREWEYTDKTRNICWYWKKTRAIRDIIGWEKVATNLMYMELFPYRSIRLMYPKTLPPRNNIHFTYYANYYNIMYGL